MFKKIAGGIEYPKWCRHENSRWRWLDLRDRLLDGTFYDHLPYAFYEEMDHQDKLIPIIERRPSSRYNIPAWLGRWCARKLWAGRHAPRVDYPDEDGARRIQELLNGACFSTAMLEATLYGSVGSVGITIRVDQPHTPEAQVALKVWRPKYCLPKFDALGNLSELRINYMVSGYNLVDQFTGIDVAKNYWFIRDYTDKAEITYHPMDLDDYNPEQGAHNPAHPLRMFDEIPHNLGFVPAVWIKNIPGSSCPSDGACLWEQAIPFAIEIDYLLSQTSRGVRYNCAPQLVVIGNFAGNEEGSSPQVTRGPMNYLHLAAGFRDPEGNTALNGDAKLLEMSGQGTEASIHLIDKIRNMALEIIGGARKDPEKMKAPLSGRAMEFLDEDSHDLIMELRTPYGENGALPLIRKIIRASEPEIDYRLVSLKWPRLYQPTPDDLNHLLPALVQAATPIVGEPAAKGADGSSTPAKMLPSIITPEEASSYAKMAMDLDMWVNADEPHAPGSPAGRGTPDPEHLDESGHGGKNLSPTFHVNPPVEIDV